jgi:hypothetical protein
MKKQIILLAILISIFCSFILLIQGCLSKKNLRPDGQIPLTNITLYKGDLKVTFANNEPFGDSHLEGYNGIAELFHSAQDSALFEPRYAGFNLEHIFGGDSLVEYFEPRKISMELFKSNNDEVFLYQPTTSLSHFEMLTTFKTVAPYYIDITFRCVIHSKEFFKHDYAGLFFASYIFSPKDKHIYFYGTEENQTDPKWISAFSKKHGEKSTHISMNDDITNYYFAPNFNATLPNHFSKYKYDFPFYYGRFHNMVLAFMFDTKEVIRFSQSPDGAGPTNPAWDFQFIIPKAKLGKEYSFHARIVYKPFVSNRDILKEYEKWEKNLK